MASNLENEVEQGLEDSLGTSAAGRWLFKDRELLMGPVPASLIIEKLYAGEIHSDTPVANENNDEKWRSLGETSTFSVHVAKAQARQRVLIEKQAHEAKVRRDRATRLTVLIATGAALVAVVFAVVVWLVSTQPWRVEDAALADLEITVNPPVIALASAEDLARGHDLFLDVDVEVEEDTGEDAAPASRPVRRPSPRRTSTSKTASPPPEAETKATAEVVTRDADGLGTSRSYDMDHIQTVLAQQSRSLFPCIREEVRRSGFSGTIPFAFVINNNGRVERLWIDERRLRGGDMQRCFERTMANWRFKPFRGERPTVNHSFTIGG